MALIRVFRTKKEAMDAKSILDEAGFTTSIRHDNLYGTPIEEYGVPARWRLEIRQEEFEKAAQFLASKIKHDKKRSD